MSNSSTDGLFFVPTSQIENHFKIGILTDVHNGHRNLL